MTEPLPTDVDPARAVRRLAETGVAAPLPTDLDPTRATVGRRAARGVPPILEQRFEVLDRIDDGTAGQARLYRVRENGGPDQILKIYSSGHEPDPQIRETLSGRRISDLLVHIAEADVVPDGRHYELMEYLPGGDLEALRTALSSPPDPDLFREVVGQLTDAIHILHKLGVMHRDIKPGNVLLRSEPGERPPRLALIDFGISRWLDHSDIRRTQSGTIAYSAPEALMGTPSERSDWWSLGVVCFEFLTGELPYGVTDGPVIIRQVAAGRLAAFDRIADTAQRLLCQGLLLHDPEDRWDHEQVRQWLDGEPPELPQTAGVRRPPEPEADWPLPYYGEEARSRLELADMLEADWDRAAARFFGDSIGRPWWQLREWLFQFDDSPHTDVAGLKKLAKHAETAKNRESSHVLLLRLVCWLNPGRAPIYRNRLISADTLSTLVIEALEHDPTGADKIIEDLRRYDVLALLARTPDGGGLDEVDVRWRGIATTWDATPRELARAGVEPARSDAPQVRPYLLWMATGDPRFGEWLVLQVARIRSELTEEVGWFTALATAPDDTSRLRAVLLDHEARLAASRLAEERARTEQRRAWERRRDDKIRWHRDQQRMRSLGWAGAGGAIVLIAWSWIIQLSSRIPLASPRTADVAWTYAMLNLTVVLAGELSLALIMGGLYYHYRHFALFGTLVQHGNRVLHPFRTNAWGALWFIVPAVCAAMLLTIYVPYLLPLVSGLAHLGWALARHTRWRREWGSLVPPNDSPSPGAAHE